MHPEVSEPPVDSVAEPSLEESAGDHGDAGPGIRKEGALALGSQRGEGSCPSHMPISLSWGQPAPLTHTHPYSYKNSTFIDMINPVHIEDPLFIP
jgi:hypothetical protein